MYMLLLTTTALYFVEFNKHFLIEKKFPIIAITESIVDMQRFKHPSNEFVLKELAILSVDGDDDDEPTTFLFKLPYKWARLPAK